MTFDRDSAKKLDPKVAQKMLLMGGLPFDILAGILLIAGIVLLILKYTVLGAVVLVLALVAAFFGIKNIIMSKEKKERYLTSKLVAEAIKKEKENGNALTGKEIIKIKFEYDPIFHDKVVAKVHKKADNEYDRKIKACENKIKKLQSDRADEIKKLAEARWENVVKDKLSYNSTEGKVLINQNVYWFSSIKGAELYKEDSYRVETTENSKSKKNASLGGAVVGGVVAGPIGAIVGGSTLGKTTTTGASSSVSIPTCNHVGVIVDLDGFKNEIVLLDHTVDQSSDKYKTAIKNSEIIISKLHYLSTVPVPETFLKVEEEQSVVAYDEQILDAHRELDAAKADVPTYAIPEKYLSDK
ncbi:MAG: hypothetical protein IJN48_05040 [Clostridia bacterium]|nr:hypothetical protein [Clostridia bacterium]